MDRRRFLAAAGAAALGALLPRAPRAGDAAAFDAAAARDAWLAGWSTVDRQALGPTRATVEGRLPRELAGVLYRNGPAWFDRAGFRYEHWFDGDGMVHAWELGPDGVSHRARVVATPKFVREQRAGRFLVSAAGTTVPGAIPARNNDDLNTANTAVMRIGERLFALWEGGSAFELDPRELTTVGSVTWREDLAGAPFSAHPLRERDGSVWNVGSLDMLGGTGVLLWHLGADGTLLRTAIVEDAARGYLHSFATSERHLILVLAPYTMGEQGSFFERMRFEPTRAGRVAVIPKDALDAPRWFDADFAMVYHFAAAHERGGELRVLGVRHTDLDAARSPFAATLRGEPEPASVPPVLSELRVDLARGTARWHDLGLRDLEFPTFDERAERPARAPLYAPVSRGEAIAPYFDALAAIDPHRGRERVYRFGREVMVEEHRFVPRPGRRRDGEGWLVGTWLDHAAGRSGLSVFDAEHVDDGPLATASVPYTVPLGFHGWFHRRA